MACPVRKQSLVPQAVAIGCPVAGLFATAPQSRKILDLVTINPVCRESLVAASRCPLRSSWWLLCLHSAKLENFGRATVNRCRRSACQLILDDKSAQLPIPILWVHNPREKKPKNDQAGAPTSKAKAPVSPGAIAPIIAGSFRVAGDTARPGHTETSGAQTVVARCPGNGRLGVLPEKRKMMANPGGLPPFARSVKNTLSFQCVRKKVATRRPVPGCS